jgi:hypothetical protein
VRFGLFGSIVQLDLGSEGFVLRQAGLLQTGGEKWEVETQPTPLLRSLFNAMPDMEELDPLLVEFVLIYRYPHSPGFVDDRNIARRLLRLGMTSDGLATLSELVEEAAGRIRADRRLSAHRHRLRRPGP